MSTEMWTAHEVSERIKYPSKGTMLYSGKDSGYIPLRPQILNKDELKSDEQTCLVKGIF